MGKIAVIAGAGPAGLTAAYELLTKTDIKPIVFEATDAIGGIAQTYNYKGNRIDIGGHRFFSKNDRVMQWWFDKLPIQAEPEPDPEKTDKVMLKRNRISRIFYLRNFFPYPIGITLTVAMKLGLFNTFLIGLSYIRAHLFPLKDETYLDAFFINRFGRRLYRTFFKDYTEKVWGVPCSQIKSDWGAQRVKGLSLKRALVHAAKDIFSKDFKESQKKRETSLITQFFYPKFGPGQMWQTVTGAIREMGGEVHLNKRVVGVKRSAAQSSEISKFEIRNSKFENLIESITMEDIATGNREEISCDYFFSTMPIKDLIGMMQPQTPAEVRDVAKNLVYRDFLTVGLLLKKLHVQERGRSSATSVPDNWIYIQEGDVQVGRVQIFNNWSPYLVADRDTTWIGLEYFVDEGKGLWVKSDEELIELGKHEMEKIGFIQKEEVLDACVLRMPKAYPAYFGSYDQLNIVRDFTLSIPNLYLIGRNGMHRYNNQDHSMLSAMVAVDNIVAGRTDNSNIWQVNAEEEYHEEKNV